MKKSIMAITFCAIGLTTLAQTNFRHISFGEAIETAKQENKMVFIDFYADWCGPCKMMAREVFPQKKVGDFFNEKFVCIKLDAEKEGQELAKRFEVKAYPTFLILNTKEEVQLEIKGAMDADKFIAKVTDGLNPEMSPARMTERYNAGERTPELVNAYALYWMEQGKETEGFKIVDDYFTSLTDAQRLDVSNAFLFTRYTLDLNDEKGKFMVAHRNDFKEPVKTAVEDRIKKMYHSLVVSYFSGYLYRENRYQEVEYERLKKSIMDLGLDKNYAYAPMFRLIESRVKDDDATFWALCKSEYDKLDKNDSDLLIMNLTRLITTENVAILKNISTFVRTHLSELSPSAIMMAGRVLGSIESKLVAK